MPMSPATLDLIAELRAFAADPGALVYMIHPKGSRRLLLFPEQINARPTDLLLFAYLLARRAGHDPDDPD